MAAPAHDAAPPHWDTLPLALVEGRQRPVLRAVTAAAARQHVRAGMAVSEARSRCAGLALLAWDDTVIARELARATAAFLSTSPQVNPVERTPGTWWVGAGGFEQLGGERLLARTLPSFGREGASRTCCNSGDARSSVVNCSTTWVYLICTSMRC